MVRPTRPVASSTARRSSVGGGSGRDAKAALDDNDAYHFLRATGDLIVSGPTHTNLLDLYVVLRG